MNKQVQGKIYYCDDYVNTDVMAPGRYDPIYEDSKLAKIALIDYQGIEPFVDQVKGVSSFSIIIAGKDFGCGSSRETAPLALSAAGVKVIIAKSFARIFFRNCINFGKIYPLELDHTFDQNIHGRNCAVNFELNKLKVGDVEEEFKDLGILSSIFNGGGLSEYVLKNRGFGCL